MWGHRYQSPKQPGSHEAEPTRLRLQLLGGQDAGEGPPLTSGKERRQPRSGPHPPASRKKLCVRKTSHPQTRGTGGCEAELTCLWPPFCLSQTSGGESPTDKRCRRQLAEELTRPRPQSGPSEDMAAPATSVLSFFFFFLQKKNKLKRPKRLKKHNIK